MCDRRNSYLEDQVSPLHTQIRGDVFVDGPRKLIVQFPGNSREQHEAKRDDAWNSDQVRVHVVPKVVANLLLASQNVDGIFDLVRLDGGIGQEGQVRYTYADDLNRVLQPQRVVCKTELVQESEDKEGEISGDRMGLCR